MIRLPIAARVYGPVSYIFFSASISLLTFHQRFIFRPKIGVEPAVLIFAVLPSGVVEPLSRICRRFVGCTERSYGFERDVIFVAIGVKRIRERRQLFAF